MAFGGGGGGGGGCLGGSSSSATFFERFGVSLASCNDRSVGGSDSSTTPWVGGGGAGSVSVGEMRPTSALSFSISLRSRSFSSLNLCSSAFGRIIIGELRVDDEPRDDGGGGFVPLACLTGVAITVVVGLSGDGSGIPFFACCRAAATNGSLLPPPADGCCDLGGGVRSVLAKSLSIARSGPSRLGGCCGSLRSVAGAGFSRFEGGSGVGFSPRLDGCGSVAGAGFSAFAAGEGFSRLEGCGSPRSVAGAGFSRFVGGCSGVGLSRFDGCSPRSVAAAGFSRFDG